jgi:transcriptional regulator with XRE-family HTH domain
MEQQQLGAKIKGLREAAGISQIGLAGRLGMSRSTLCNYEAGRETMSGERYDECFFVLKALVAERDAAWVNALTGAGGSRDAGYAGPGLCRKN